MIRKSSVYQNYELWLVVLSSNDCSSSVVEFSAFKITRDSQVFSKFFFSSVTEIFHVYCK